MFYLVVSGGYPLHKGGRTLLLVWTLFLFGGFALAFRLDPDPRGYGTHQKLGLPPCTFRDLTGVPCPSCGMTTSFAHFVRGNFAGALRANPAGCLLAFLCVFQIPWCWWSAISGKLCGMSEPVRTCFWGLIGFFTICAINWAIQICLQ